MSKYRPILPQRRSPEVANNEEDIQERPRKRRAIIAQACHFCREKKAKCDGARPTCLNCASKNKECVYDGEEGQSRSAALKARVESLEKLVDQLQSGKPGQSSGSNDPIGASVDRTVGHLSKLSARLSFPTASTTQTAVDGFFSCSGKLFHVFSRTQVAEIFQSVFQSQGESDSGRDQKSDLCCLMAIAAVGCQYSQDETDREVEDIFYCLAQHHLDDVMETRPMDAIKVCTLFGMYNIFKKATASLAYVDIGLGICRRFGLDSEILTPKDLVWFDYRKTWRTLIFLSTWLSATLGCKSGNEELLGRISPSQLEVGDSSDISETIQTEMAKIAMLKAHILQMHLAFKDFTLLSIQSIMRDLQAWYEKMPPIMHLESIGQTSLPVEARRSICHVHLLYLGANMLLFRRIASQLVRSSARGVDQGILWQPSESTLKEQSERALSAASSSARIIKILLDDNGVFKRCWLVMSVSTNKLVLILKRATNTASNRFQTYTSCVIILHAISQKQAANLDPLTWKGDMANAKLCLEALTFCGSLDPVAARFHDRLSTIYESLLSLSQVGATSFPGSYSFDETSQETSATNAPTTSTLNPPLPVQASPSQLSFDLLELLCRPFGDPSHKEMSKECLASESCDPTRYEHPQLVTRLDWDFESKAPFVWSLHTLGIGSGEASLPGPQYLGRLPRRHFLDSTTPSGWVPT
ncbi:uncharacterized protein F4822DRAFT_442532 [Hypoxylon trugodes]|uniref:uncharacterized protein n=1 Tax=Hypoxylon trugodes TaxID=326681 RepID=UPI0021A0ADDB|nr:uncharacterized protein F4822DRAFT_442532 [Hypoxylon trugodes]KAI1391592.1 hypothetical protein F4822DRAFT_442532 [Hypoxylon trugodes]